MTKGYWDYEEEIIDVDDKATRREEYRNEYEKYIRWED